MQIEQQQYWSPLTRICFRFFTAFTLLLIFTFPFDYSVLPSPAQWLRPVFESTAQWAGTHLLHIRQPAVMQLFSDTTGLYVHCFNMLLLSVLVTIAWTLTDRRKAYPRLLYGITALVRYYLALQLLIYGFNKVFKAQFYLPEPNTIYTPLAQVPRDLLYWTTMGLSRPYTVAMGVAEVLAALLLLFRRTAIAGALVSFGILTNVFLINLSYDISVKLHSGMLLLFSILLLLPDAKRICAFFTRRPATVSTVWQPTYSSRTRWWYVITKLIILCLLFTETLLPYIRAHNYNDDIAPRPFLHGAYEVSSFVRNGDTIPPLLTDTRRWKRLFIHRQHYCIIQGMNDDMQDFALAYDTARRSLVLTLEADGSQFVLHYQVVNDSLFRFSTMLGNDSIDAECKKLDWRSTPLLKKEFGWTID